MRERHEWLSGHDWWWREWKCWDETLQAHEEPRSQTYIVADSEDLVRGIEGAAYLGLTVLCGE